MILFIDHRDSFSWNLIAQLRGLGYEVEVRQSEALVSDSIAEYLQNKQALFFSPGPGHPRDYPNSMALYRAAKGKIPIVGVCLGFQIMLEAEGIGIGRLPEILHGVQTPISIDSSAAAYIGIGNPPRVGRYHSLGLPLTQLPDGWKATGWDTRTERMLSFENLSLQLFGFQYHPDSFLTPDGDRILANALSTSLPVSSNQRVNHITKGNLWEKHGAFTTLRLSIRKQGAFHVATLWFPKAHANRLQRDLSALGQLQETSFLLQNRFVNATKAEAHSLAEGEWLVRWSCAPPHSAIEARPLVTSNPLINGKCLNYLRRLSQLKNLYYSALINQLQQIDRRSTELLLVHPKHQLLLEGVTCNLIFIRDEQCFTPSNDCLPGLTLQLLESHLPASVTVIQKPIPIDTIDQYDAIVACGTGRGIIPIHSIPELHWQQRETPLVDYLQQTYQSLIRTTYDRIEFPID
jgi:anthranilate synthase/aminodeoxychorismate synthase-like glutamine amidotransferase